MRVTLIHGRFPNSWEALGLGYIGAYLRAHRPDIELRFFQGCFDSDDEIVEGAAGSDVVAFSCTSPAMVNALDLAARIKVANPKVRTVFGGYHPSALPYEVLKNPCVDTVVVGEGEQALLDIVNGDGRRLIRAERIPMDDLIWPDRRLIRNARNIAVAFKDNGRRIASFQAHRGCPYRCKFCADGANKTVYGPKVFDRNCRNLASEIAWTVKQWNLDYFKFCDSTWNTNRRWVDEFCAEKARASEGTPFFANIHAANTSGPMFDRMKRVDCDEIGLGIESGSDSVLASVGKGITTEDVRRAVRHAQAVGLKIRGYFFIGTPTETEADLEATERFAEELNLDEYGFSILCPYPGSAYHDENPERFKGIDWSGTDEYHNDFWSTAHLSNERLKEWQARLRQKFSQRMTQRQAV